MSTEKFASLRVSYKGDIELHIAYKEGYDEKIRINLTPDEAMPIAKAIDEVTGTAFVRNMVHRAVSAREKEKERLRGIIKRAEEKLEELE